MNAEQAARKILRLAVADNDLFAMFPVLDSDNGAAIADHGGLVQCEFLKAGTLAELKAGLAYAVDHEWLLLGNAYGDVVMYLVKPHGFGIVLAEGRPRRDAAGQDQEPDDGR